MKELIMALVIAGTLGIAFFMWAVIRGSSEQWNSEYDLREQQKALAENANLRRKGRQ